MEYLTTKDEWAKAGRKCKSPKEEQLTCTPIGKLDGISKISGGSRFARIPLTVIISVNKTRVLKSARHVKLKKKFLGMGGSFDALT